MISRVRSVRNWCAVGSEGSPERGTVLRAEMPLRPTGRAIRGYREPLAPVLELDDQAVIR
jgi:hypothetical protein